MAASHRAGLTGDDTDFAAVWGAAALAWSALVVVAVVARPDAYSGSS